VSVSNFQYHPFHSPPEIHSTRTRNRTNFIYSSKVKQKSYLKGIFLFYLVSDLIFCCSTQSILLILVSYKNSFLFHLVQISFPHERLTSHLLFSLFENTCISSINHSTINQSIIQLDHLGLFPHINV